MPLGTVDRTPPPFFKQGASALSKLLVFSALAVLLMVLDARMHWAVPVRSALATVLYPLQWTAMLPIRALQWSGQYVGSLSAAQQEAREARAELVRQVQRAAIVEHLSQENRELRTLLGMGERLPPGAQGAEILYEVADPYSRKVMINIGQTAGVKPGSAVMDGYGVMGQVTRVYPMTAEVTLLIDGKQAIPLVNTRTGQRSLAYGAPTQGDGRLELRFESIHTETQAGDILTTSGVDGIYPPGLPVARVLSVTTRDGSGFARVECEPLARMRHSLHVLVSEPATSQPAPTPPGQRP
jgi:rod shape-determining protein MreC